MSIYEPVIYTPVYNDAEALRKSAEKMKHLGLKRLVIDGRYHSFEKMRDSDVSTDDIMDVCTEYGFDYVVCAPCLEEQKFNLACQILASQNHKVMILCAADEWYTMTFKGLALKWIEDMCTGAEYPMLFGVAIDEKRPNHMYSQDLPFLPKIFYNLDKIENRHVHWATYVKDSNRLLQMFPYEVPSVILHHDNHLRSEERDEMMIRFQDENIRREKDTSMPIRRDRFYGR
jgi:hypothetical protein